MGDNHGVELSVSNRRPPGRAREATSRMEIKHGEMSAMGQ